MKKIAHLQQLPHATIIGLIILLTTGASLALLSIPARAQSSKGTRATTLNNFPNSTIISSDIVTNTTWDLAHSPYLVQADITVNPTVTLTVEPGVQVIFDQYDSLDVQGTLSAAGTATQPITFTASSQTPGWWSGVQIESSDHSHINSSEALSYGTIASAA